jgi:hypothetical protein
MFHEFGQRLHGMFSNVKYPYFSGTSVPRDFVEYPSQVNEMWADWPEVLANYAKHYQTGAPMPKELLDKVLASSKFNQGFTTTEYLGAAMLDQRWHQMESAERVPSKDGVMAFEAAALKKDGLDFGPVPAALPHAVLQPHHGWLRSRLLRLHLVGSARCRQRGLDEAERWPDPRQRRPLPRHPALARRQQGRAGAVP